MVRGFALTHIHVGHAGAHHGKRANAACSTGGFYTGPTNGQSVNANSPLNITWDTSCLDTKTVDIYLYAPGSTKSLVHEWENVQFAPGSYLATLKSQWWNSTSSIDLQLSIVQSGSPVFSSPMPAGPIFNATSSSSGSSITGGASEAGITNVGSVSVKHGLSGGEIAAAVIIPVLLIISLCVAYYLKISRAKGRDESRRRSEAIDRRMSTVSTDWKPMSISGASAAVRNSLAYNNRASNFSFGAPRPSSDYTLDGGKAGIGTNGIYAYHTDGNYTSQMSHARSGSRPSVTSSGDRVSRVSFAADPRPTADRRSTIVSRAYHNAFVPPVPSHMDSHELSPFQTQGPFSLSQEDIRARVSSNSGGGSGGDDVDVLPALTLMRTGDIDSGNEDDFILSRTPPPPSPPALPTPPTPTYQQATSSPITKQAVSVMSPDDLLRAYAARKVTSPTSSPGPGSLSYPAPVVNHNGNGMRILYSPVTPGSAPGSAVPMVRDMRPAYPYNEDDNEDAYASTAL